MRNAPVSRDRAFYALQCRRWIWGSALVLGQLWSLMAVDGVTLVLHRSGSPPARPVLILAVAGVATVLMGWGLFFTARLRAAGLLWMLFATVGAGLVAAIGHWSRAKGVLWLFVAMAVSGIVTLAVGWPRSAKPVLVAALAFGLVVAWGTGREWANGRLWRAVRSRDLGEVRRLVAGSAEVDREGPAGVAPLMAAVAAGDTEIVRVLVEGGASVYARDADGRSAMMLALERKDDAVAVALLLALRQRLDRSVGGGAR